MKLSMLWAIPLLATLPTATDRGSAETLRFDVTEGTVLRKTFRETTSWVLDEFQQLYDGREVTGNVEDMSSEFSGELELLDSYGETVDGRPQEIERVLETAEAETFTSILVSGRQEDHELTLKSPMADATLAIEWNKKEQTYEITTEDEVREARLKELEEDMDFRCLLPEEEVAEGDSWKIDAGELGQMLAPGGDWVLLPEDLPDDSYEVLEPEDLFACVCATLGLPGEELSGDAVVVWEETREENGHRLAVLAIELEAEISCDHAERIQDMGDAVGHSWSRDETIFLLEWDLEGEGQLIWDLDASHFHSFSFEAKSGLSLELAWLADTGDTEVDLAILGDLATTSRLEARAVLEKK